MTRAQRTRIRHSIVFIVASMFASGCDMTPEQQERLLAISNGLSAAGQSLQASENAMYNNSRRSMGGGNLVGTSGYGTSTVCQYSDGTAVRIRGGLCPLSN